MAMMAATPRMAIKNATTTKEYGRLRASLTIDIRVQRASGAYCDDKCSLIHDEGFRCRFISETGAGGNSPCGYEGSASDRGLALLEDRGVVERRAHFTAECARRSFTKQLSRSPVYARIVMKRDHVFFGNSARNGKVEVREPSGRQTQLF